MVTKIKQHYANPGVIPTSDGPPVLLFTGWAVYLTKRLHGFREPSAMFGKHKRTVSRRLAALKPKTSDSINHQQLTLPPALFAELKEYRLNTIAEQSPKLQHDETYQEMKARFEKITAPPEILSGFFMSLPDQPEDSLPFTRQLAAEIDSLSKILLAEQIDGKGGSLEGYKRALLGSLLVREEHWILPLDGSDLRSLFEQTTDWHTAWTITEFLIFHQKIALLAAWDVEYCNATFSGLRAIPLFLQLAPRLRSRTNGQSAPLRRTNARRADVTDSAFGQLIDLTWCLLHRTRNGCWPDRLPTDEKMSQALNNSRYNLADLRMGRPNLTMALFSMLWPDNVRNKDGEPLGPPVTLLAVAHIWDMVHSNQMNIPIDQYYMRAWNQYKKMLLSDSRHEARLVDDWPPYLDRGLDYPAPE